MEACEPTALALSSSNSTQSLRYEHCCNVSVFFFAFGEFGALAHCATYRLSPLDSLDRQANTSKTRMRTRVMSESVPTLQLQRGPVVGSLSIS